MRALAACLVASSLYGTARAQQPECHIDNQCQNGYYCVTDTFVCKKCIDCADLNRETPLGGSLCIKSVAECGPCFKGLVGIDAECAEAGDASRAVDAVPPYVWVAISIGLLLFVVVVLLVVYVLRNPYTFKILASTRTSVQSACNRNGVSASAPAAPDAPQSPPPPPYHAHYTPVRPSSPPADTGYPAYPADAPHTAPNDEAWEYVKREAGEGGAGAGGAAREAAGSQAARPFNYPSYVRGPSFNSPPPSYDATNEEERDILHDEDTVESTWTPTPDTHTSSGGELSSLLAAARSTSLLRAPHAPLAPHAAHAAHPAHHTHLVTTPHCAHQDTNNNRSSGETLGNGDHSGPSHSGGTSFIINVVQNNFPQ